MNSFHGGMNSGTRWNEFIPGGMNSFYSRVSYTVDYLLPAAQSEHLTPLQMLIYPEEDVEETSRIL